MSVKISITGAGGANFGIGFAKNICDSRYLTDCTVVMMDISKVTLCRHSTQDSTLSESFEEF